MRLFTTINIGDALQPIYLIDDNNYPTIVAHTSLNSLGNSLCAIYYANNCHLLTIEGAKDIAARVAGQASEASKEYYQNRPGLNIEIM